MMPTNRASIRPVNRRLRWNLTNEAFPIGPDGRIAIPQGPGLGVSLNEETVARFRIA